MALLPALIAGGSSLLGGLLDRRANRRAAERDYQRSRADFLGDGAEQFVRLRAAAKKGGFNPLTALMATGGGQGYQGAAGNTLSSGAIFSQAIARGVDTYFNTPDPADVEAETIRRQATSDMVNRAAAARDPFQNFGYALTKVRPFSRAVESGLPGMITRRDLTLANIGLRAPVVGSVGVPERFLDRGSGSFVANRYWEAAPGWSPTEQVENEYGDLVGALYGVAKVSTDVGHNFGLFARRKYDAWSKPSERPLVFHKSKPNALRVEIPPRYAK